jgi:hypothetical protein
MFRNIFEVGICSGACVHPTYSTTSGKPLSYLAQQDGGGVTPSNWEGKCDRGPESVSLWGETLSGANEVLPVPWLTEEADNQKSHQHAEWPALGRELFSHIQTSMSEMLRVPSCYLRGNMYN